MNWIGIVIGVIGLGSLFFSLGVYSNNANNDSTTNNNGSNSGEYTNNLKDIVYAMEYVNLDGKVDGKDQVILSKYLARESGYDKLPYVK